MRTVEEFTTADQPDDYAKFKDFLSKTHPGDLNYDLNKLIKSALIRATGFIKRLYLDTLKEEHELTIWQKFRQPSPGFVRSA